MPDIAPPRERLLHRSAIVLLLAAAGSALLTIAIAWACQWRGPFRDLWELMPMIEASFNGQLHWQDLWAPYGGAHRMVIPRLLFIAEYHLTGGSNRLVLVVSLACLAMTAALLQARVRQAFRDDHSLQALSLAIILYTLFSTTQLFNLNYSYDTQWFGAIAFSILALYLATHPALATHPVRYVTGAVIAVVLASGNNLVGLMAWPPLAILLWLRVPSRSWRTILPIALGIGALAYLQGIGANGPDLVDHEHPVRWWCLFSLQALQYLALYLGSPLSRSWPVVTGIGVVMACTWILWRTVRWQRLPENQRPLVLLLAAVLAQCCLTALATAWGRAWYGMDMATTDRYQAIAMLFWLCTGLTGLCSLQTRQRLLMPAAPLLLAALLLPHQWQSVVRHADLASTVTRGHLGAAMGITDMRVARNTLSFPAIATQRNFVAAHNSFLQAHRLAYFDQPDLHWLGETVRTTATPGECRWQIIRQAPVDDSGAVELWAVPQCTMDQASAVLLVDGAQQVQGLLIPPRLAHRKTAFWGGYARVPASGLIAIPVTNGQPGQSFPLQLP